MKRPRALFSALVCTLPVPSLSDFVRLGGGPIQECDWVSRKKGRLCLSTRLRGVLFPSTILAIHAGEGHAVVLLTSSGSLYRLRSGWSSCLPPVPILVSRTLSASGQQWHGVASSRACQALVTNERCTHRGRYTVRGQRSLHHLCEDHVRTAHCCRPDYVSRLPSDLWPWIESYLRLVDLRSLFCSHRAAFRRSPVTKRQYIVRRMGVSEAVVVQLSPRMFARCILCGRYKPELTTRSDTVVYYGSHGRKCLTNVEHHASGRLPERVCNECGSTITVA